jgi:lipoprotein-anchoring transpeptidase ErfK/SrfK
MDAIKKNTRAIKIVCIAFIASVCSSLFAAPAPSTKSYQILASNTFIFYPKKLRWVAVDSNGKVVKSGVASGGRNYCPDIKRACRTPTGTFHVLSEGGASCRSSRYPVGHGGAKMPYCMFFTSLYAIHGSYELPHYNASHGCIRVKPADAKWLQQNFIKIGTKVVVEPY